MLLVIVYYSGRCAWNPGSPGPKTSAATRLVRSGPLLEIPRQIDSHILDILYNEELRKKIKQIKEKLNLIDLNNK